MIIHSIISIQNIFWQPFSDQIEEINYQGIKLQVIKMENNKYKIIRVISSNPDDFMRFDIQPGCDIYL